MTSPTKITPLKTRIVRFSVLLVLTLPTVFLSPSTLAQACVKQVFNRYCLGATPGSLSISAEQISAQNGTVVYRVRDEKKHLELSTHNNQISAVARREAPGSWLNFTHWKAKLIRLYGQGETLGQFPDYATSRSSRLNAINAGKGFAHIRWQRGEWSVALIWDHRDYIILRYALNTLDDTDNNSEGL